MFFRNFFSPIEFGEQSEKKFIRTQCRESQFYNLNNKTSLSLSLSYTRTLSLSVLSVILTHTDTLSLAKFSHCLFLFGEILPTV